MRTLNIFNNPIVWVSSLSYYYSDSNLGGSREKMYTFLCVAVSLFFLFYFFILNESFVRKEFWLEIAVA